MSKPALPPAEFILRDLREQDWFWLQNELLDFFAPQIGADAVCVYISLSRACYGKCAVVSLTLREIESQWSTQDGRHAIGKSTVSRSLESMVRLGMIRALGAGGPRRKAEYGLVSLQKLARNLGYDGVPWWDKNSSRSRRKRAKKS